MAMLACARIGAIHSVVYAGLGRRGAAAAHRGRRREVVLCCRRGLPPGKADRPKAIVDEAVEGNPQVEHVVRPPPGDPGPGAAARARPTSPTAHAGLAGHPLRGDGQRGLAVHPLHLGHDRQAQGRRLHPRRLHGGRHATCARIACDIRENDIYWCTSDIGWIVGHSHHGLRPAGERRHHPRARGRAGLPAPGHRLGDRRAVPRDQAVHRADGGAHVHAVRRGAAPRATTCSSLRLLVCAGEPLNPEAQHWAYEHIVRRRGPVLRQLVADRDGGARPSARCPAWPSKPGRAGRPLPRHRGRGGGLATGSPVARRAGRAALVLRGAWPHMLRTIWGDPTRYEAYWQPVPGVLHRRRRGHAWTRRATSPSWAGRTTC